MNKFLIFTLIVLIMLSSFTSGLFGPKTPPPSPLGAYCSVYGCNFSGDVFMGWNTIFDVVLNNTILHNATIINGTFTGMVNYTQVQNPIWVEVGGDNMTGPLSMQFNPVYNMSFVSSDDWSNVSITESQIVDLNHTVNTEKGTIGFYLYNDSLYIYLNETKLNQTIQDLDTNTNTHISADDFYLTDDFTTMYFNESKLNQTIQDLDVDTDTHTTAVGPYISNDSVYMYFNESKLNNTISLLDINTWWPLAVGWFFNNSGSLDFNESKLNTTIDARDNNTHVEGDNIYLYNDTKIMYMNESKLNQTIVASINYSIQNQTGCSNPLVACVNRENTFEKDQYIVEGFRFNFRNGTNNTYFFYNITNQTLQLWVNGFLQQDWGSSTTVYGEATFLGNLDAQNITGEGVYFDVNLIVNKNITTHQFFIGNGTLITDVCHADGSGCGPGQVDTQKNTIGFYLYNDSAIIYFNETKLNETINNYVSTANIIINWSTINNTPDFVIDGDNIYLYKDSSILYFNETKLNETISALDVDTDTHVESDNFYLTNDSTIMYFNETKLNDTIDARDTFYPDTQKDTTNFYLFNDSIFIYFNETQLNETIKLLENDTLYFAGGLYINLDGTNTFWLNETKLNDTIDLRDDYESAKNTNGFYLHNDSVYIYFNESQLNDTIDLRDTDTTYTNGTGLELIGTEFSLNTNYTDGRYYTQGVADTRFLLVTGGVVNGNVIFNGNFTLIGDIFNATVTNQFLNGSLIPQLHNIFNIGDLQSYWNAAYINTIYANDWSNVSITESQISDLIHTGAGLPYLYQVGSLIYFNETKLNNTIKQLDTDTQKGTDGLYLYNDSLIIYFNETKLNDTIDLRDADTTYTAGEIYIILNNTIFYLNESKLNETIAVIAQSINTDTHTEGDNVYLYNDSTTMYFNETMLNNTIDLRDDYELAKSTTKFYLFNDSTFIYFNESQLNATIELLDNDTLYFAGGVYVYLDGINTFWFNETKLNNTIDSRDTDTHTEGDNVYLYNDSTTMFFNETKLNGTIDDRDQYEPDTHVEGVGYLYNDSIYMHLNSVLLNATIDDRDKNTEKYGAQPYLYNDSDYIYLNETELNATIDDRELFEPDTQKGTTGFYLYNDSVIIYFNESQLNATIEALDTDTTYTAGGVYIYLSGTVFWLNETKLNLSINDYVMGMGLVNSEKEGAQPYLYNDSTYIYLNETKFNNSILSFMEDLNNGSVYEYTTQWAEENSGLNNGAYEWAYGNGANSQTGLVQMRDGKVVAISLACLTAGAGVTEVKLEKNSVNTGCNISLAGSVADGYNSCDLSFVAGDRLNARTVTAGSASNCVVSWAIREEATVLVDVSIYNLTSDTHIEGDGFYLTNDSTTMYFNETKLNQTINRTFGLREEYVNIAVSGGSGTAITTECCYPSGEILQVQVVPTTPTNVYRFKANGTVSGEIVDPNRRWHIGTWRVGHKGTILFGETISLYIINANIDETFQVRIRWRP